jgi:GNAT superfamily N-acetyltransferase
MADARFEKLAHSDEALYGPRKLVLCGFGREAQPKFKKVLDFAGLADVPVVWATADDATEPVRDLFQRPADSGLGIGSALKRAVIMAGITENELHTLMNVCKKTGMQSTLWAALTPTSETWTLKALLEELSAERRQLGGKRG